MAGLESAKFIRRGSVAERIVSADCDGHNVRTATLTTQFVYLRCGDGGEGWSIPDRRQTPRDDARTKFQP